MEIYFNVLQPPARHHMSQRWKTGTTHIQFDSTAASSSTHSPPLTRKLTWASKANQKIEGDANVEVDKLFEMLAQEFHAIERTCEKIMEEINKNA
jgi:hypothetical protein